MRIAVLFRHRGTEGTEVRSGTRLAFVLSLCPLCLCGNSAAQTPLLEVEGERVTAADLARVLPQWSEAPPAAEVLYAPLPGLGRDVVRAELSRLASRHGVEGSTAADWPLRLRIRRRMRSLEALEAEAALAGAIAARYRIPPDDVSVELVGFSPPQVPAGELQFRAPAGLPPSPEPASIPLTWVTRQHRSGTLWLRARLSARGSYALAARPIQAGKPLAPDDVVFAEGPLHGPPDRWRLLPADLAGKAAARPIAAGERIGRWLLISVPAVERGAVVELRLKHNGIELRAPARAERAAAAGDRLVFRNLNTGRRVTARLLNPHQAEVERGPRK